MEEVQFARPDITQLEESATLCALRQGWLTSGRRVEAFEKAFRERVGSAHAVATNSATSASRLVFDALRVRGDQVVFPTYTHTGPVMEALKAGAKVQLVDCAEGSFQMDIEAAMDVGRGRWLAVPTHFAGDVIDLSVLSHPKGLLDIVEDAAHAFPAMLRGDAVGSCRYSVATFFSFYATKPITTGDGGMITTNEPSLYSKLRPARAFGINKDTAAREESKRWWDYDVVSEGSKANMTDLAAAIGLVQLHRADAMRAVRAWVAEAYSAGLPYCLERPAWLKGSALHLYPVLVPEAGGRDAFILRMRELGVQCGVHFRPIHTHSFYKKELGYTFGNFPVAERRYAHEVSLPIWSSMRREQIHQVVEAAQLAAREIFGA